MERRQQENTPLTIVRNLVIFNSQIMKDNGIKFIQINSSLGRRDMCNRCYLAVIWQLLVKME